jgi:3-deoxy-manno-octulosonate cytidylyltransferase (CMP-KDO synthetase)
VNVLVIPARWGSTRFPGKPLADIAGVPMVVRVWERVRQCAGFDRVVVATDDERVMACCHANGVDYETTSGDCRNGTERCAEFAHTAGLVDGDLVVNVQGDEPLMLPEIPQRILFNLKFKPERVWTAVRKVRGEEDVRRDVVKCWVQGGDIKEYTRMKTRWGRHVHVGVYGYSVKRLREYAAKKPSAAEIKEGLEQLRWREPLACITVEYDGIGVDRPSDIKRVEDRLSASIA